jgi:hypothetical protein
MWLREFFIIFGFAIAASLATSTRSVAQDFMAPPGVSAAAFPKPKRPVADIISPIWHSEKERDAVGEPRQLVQLLSIKTGMTIADIGAGSGYYVVRLAPIVGASGRIIAQDVVAEYLRSLRDRVHDLGLHNVTVALGEPHDPRLPAHSLDLAILVHMYHEITQPYGLFITSLRRSNLAGASGLSMRARRPPNTVRRPIFFAASWRLSAIARLVSIRCQGATPISRFLPRRPTTAARDRTQ